jgi:hypothetical protein
VNGRVHCELNLPLGSSCRGCGTPLSRGTCRLWPAVRREAARHVKDGTGWGDSSVQLPKTCKGGQAKPAAQLCAEAAWVRHGLWASHCDPGSLIWFHGLTPIVCSLTLTCIAQPQPNPTFTGGSTLERPGRLPGGRCR